MSNLDLVPVPGKLSYLSPEQANGEFSDHHTDQFALCVVLWELLAGRRLFAGGSASAIIRRVLAGDTPEIGHVRDDLPWALSTALARGLAQVRTDRFASCGALAQVLRRIAQQLDEQNGPFDYAEWRACLVRQAVEPCALPLADDRWTRSKCESSRAHSVTRRLPECAAME